LINLRRAAVDRIVSAALTLDQAATWQQLTGKPFNEKVWQPSFMGPGGFGRGPGRGPGGPGGGGRGGDRMDRGAGRRQDERRDAPASTEPTTKS